jgi:hypothetical protein
MRHHVGVRLDMVETADLLHLGDDFLARGKTIHAVKLLDHLDELALDLQALEEILIVLERHAAVGSQDVDRLEVMSLADLEIVEIMRRRDLHRAGPGRFISIIVANDRYAPSDQRQHDMLADQVLDSADPRDSLQCRSRQAWFLGALSRQ